MSGKKVLVIKLCCLGDIIQLTPALRALKESGAQVHFLCINWVKDITGLIPYIDRIHIFEPKSIAKILPALFSLRREKFDAVINFHRDVKSYIFADIIGAEKRAGFIWKGKGKKMDFTAEFDTSLHETERYLSVTDAMGIQRKEGFTYIDIPGKPEMDIPAIGKGENIGIFTGGGKNPGTIMTGKRWPLENFIELARDLSKAGKKVFVFGGEMDRDTVDPLLQAVPEAVPVITGLKDFVYYVSKMRCFAASDTGPLHLAAAAGVNTIGLFGPSSPDVFGARGRNSVNITADESCAPCYEPESVHKKEFLKCTDNICMKKITVSMVMEEIKTMLGEQF